MTSQKETLIPKHGGYRKLKSFQVVQLACDLYRVRNSARGHNQ